MSKSLRPFLLTTAALVVLLCSLRVDGQDIEATIRIDEEGRSARVKGRFLGARSPADGNKLSFLHSYAGMVNIGWRTSEVYTTKSDGTDLALVKMLPGDYRAVSKITDWSYRMDLKPLEYREAAAHLSWIDGERGFIVLDDILPQGGLKTAKIKLDLPAGWKVFSTEPTNAANEFIVEDIEKAVFVIGRGWRERDIVAGGTGIKMLVAGDWLFSDDDAAVQAAEVFAYYKDLFGSAPRQRFQIAFIRFPSRVPTGNWEAGSRGSSITMASSDMAFKSQSMQRLHEQLRHEIFHFWVPNGLELEGSYDWFYEGFALYESLKLGVSVNRIRFEDMLDTLSRAFAADSRVPDGIFGERPSLIAASEHRWTGANTAVYARGMLIAFLCDLATLEASKGKRSISDYLRAIYELHRLPGSRQDGNAAILGALRSHRELVPLVDSYITGNQKITWEPLLKAAGLEASEVGNLRVVAKPAGRQKQLLNKLGYNNWRKLSTSNK